MEQFSDRAMRGEAEMGWTYTKEGLGYCLYGKGAGMELPGSRKRGRPRRRYMDFNCEGG